MVTIANAQFPDSDHEDEDFEAPELLLEAKEETLEEDEQTLRKRRRASKLWEELQEEELKSKQKWLKRPRLEVFLGEKLAVLVGVRPYFAWKL